MAERFVEDAHRVDSTTELVRCPACDGRAVATRDRVVCTACGFARTAADGAVGRADGAPRDPWFGLPLWLQTACRGETLWARNESHLDFLEAYVGADLRERRPYVNRSLASRLPGWIKDASARDDVLRAIAKLRATL